ncbi:MAG TPA: DegV family protein [Anaerolineae bacterium]|nr:DegV family protein [Anaerolineae bacterium]HID83971.1 DegV family protein [Anaerolineales bacterium]HIQ09263.1 DegV family protein [Anaerolineaceae bacterium]
MVHIVTDTTSCLPPEVAEQYDIPVIPQVIHLGEETYAEGRDLTLEQFLDYLVSHRGLPKTSAPPPAWFVPVFQRLTATGEPVLCIHPSTDLSGTVRSATVAAQDFPDADIRVLDTRLIAVSLGKVVELAAQWAAQGMDADTLEQRVMDMARRNRLYFVVDTLDYLAQGGRIGKAAHLLGTALRIKPILALEDGVIVAHHKERTLRRALDYLTRTVVAEYPRQGEGHLQVMHAAVPERAQALAERLAAELGLEEVPIAPLPPAIITHAGPGALAVSFFRDAA